MNRRLFLAQAPALVAARGVPGLWKRAALAAGPASDASSLVVVELTGGNDGLNMVVPYRDDAYHRARPTLRIAPDKVLKLDDTLGLHPAMKDLHKLWDAGKLRVAMNVGYPRPSRSHTRAMEIWQAGETGPTPISGWLGRASDGRPECVPPCFVGSTTTPLAIRGHEVAPMAVGNLDAMKLQAGARFIRAADLDDQASPAARVSTAMLAAKAIGDKLAAIGSVGPTGDRDGLDSRLATIRSLIESDFGSRVYYTSLDGFDTHQGQEYTHQNLLRRLSEALARFQADLAERKLDDRVVVLVFSEFGRRVAENGSKGTDHGAAAPVLVLGSPVEGGLLGKAPDLADLDEGDIRHTLDFRHLYASVLGGWLRVDPASVLGRDVDASARLFRS